jgi:dihydroorotase
VAVTCEAAPHHFALSDEAVQSFDTNLKMSPPLRSARHVAALKAALADGTADAIATDHAPHTIQDKESRSSTTRRTASWGWRPPTG